MEVFNKALKELGNNRFINRLLFTALSLSCHPLYPQSPSRNECQSQGTQRQSITPDFGKVVSHVENLNLPINLYSAIFRFHQPPEIVGGNNIGTNKGSCTGAKSSSSGHFTSAAHCFENCLNAQGAFLEARHGERELKKWLLHSDKPTVCKIIVGSETYDVVIEALNYCDRRNARFARLYLSNDVEDEGTEPVDASLRHFKNCEKSRDIIVGRILDPRLRHRACLPSIQQSNFGPNESLTTFGYPAAVILDKNEVSDGQSLYFSRGRTTSPDDRFPELIRTSAKVYAGMSGSPIVNSSNVQLGVTSASGHAELNAANALAALFEPLSNIGDLKNRDGTSFEPKVLTCNNRTPSR